MIMVNSIIVFFLLYAMGTKFDDKDHKFIEYTMVATMLSDIFKVLGYYCDQ